MEGVEYKDHVNLARVVFWVTVAAELGYIGVGWFDAVVPTFLAMVLAWICVGLEKRIRRMQVQLRVAQMRADKKTVKAPPYYKPVGDESPTVRNRPWWKDKYE